MSFLDQLVDLAKSSEIRLTAEALQARVLREQLEALRTALNRGAVTALMGPEDGETEPGGGPGAGAKPEHGPKAEADESDCPKGCEARYRIPSRKSPLGWTTCRMCGKEHKPDE